jgi:hypothetical protein
MVEVTFRKQWRRAMRIVWFYVLAAVPAIAQFDVYVYRYAYNEAKSKDVCFVGVVKETGAYGVVFNYNERQHTIQASEQELDVNRRKFVEDFSTLPINHPFKVEQLPNVIYIDSIFNYPSPTVSSVESLIRFLTKKRGTVTAQDVAAAYQVLDVNEFYGDARPYLRRELKQKINRPSILLAVTHYLSNFDSVQVRNALEPLKQSDLYKMYEDSLLKPAEQKTATTQLQWTLIAPIAGLSLIVIVLIIVIVRRRRRGKRRVFRHQAGASMAIEDTAYLGEHLLSLEKNLELLQNTVRNIQLALEQRQKEERQPTGSSNFVTQKQFMEFSGRLEDVPAKLEQLQQTINTIVEQLRTDVKTEIFGVEEQVFNLLRTSKAEIDKNVTAANEYAAQLVIALQQEIERRLHASEAAQGERKHPHEKKGEA